MSKIEGKILLPGDLSKVTGKRVEGPSPAYGPHGLSLGNKVVPYVEEPLGSLLA